MAVQLDQPEAALQVPPEPEHPTPAPPAQPTASLRPVVVAVAAFAVAHYFAFTRLVRGDLANSYPFASDDSFDWLLEGYAVTRWLDGVVVPELPMARNPGFVGVTFLDSWIGANGDVLLAVLALAAFASLAAPLLLARWQGTPRVQAAVVVLVLAVSPLGFLRPWILSDQMATALFVLATVCLYPYATRGSRAWLAVATLAAVAGGTTQMYALGGFLAAGGWCFAVSVWRRRPDLLLGAALLGSVVVPRVLTQVWFGQVPHGTTPDHGAFVDVGTGMFGFYANVWSYLFAPLVPLVVVLAWVRRREVLASPILTGYWLAVLGMMVATFNYQWEESRFTLPTLFMLGIAVMATLPGERPLPRPRELMGATAALAVFLGLFLVPANYWIPRWSEMSIDPADSYVAQLIEADPVDRFALGVVCGSSFRFCEAVPLPDHLSVYQRNVFSTYQQLVNAPQ